MIRITECPRDAMQGIQTFIPTEIKVTYLNQLLKVGFDILDVGSFVSPKAIPQLADTKVVLPQLIESDTELLVIVANTRGASEACEFSRIKYIGFPFSVSETFQKRNTNSTIQESLIRVEEIHNLCVQHGKTPLVYISMGFGNPYGDEWNFQIVDYWVAQLIQKGIKNISLADTVGVSTPETISYIYSNLTEKYPSIYFNAHLHSTPQQREEKIKSGILSGCYHFDTAIQGYGGCPMAKDELTGNIATEDLIRVAEILNVPNRLNLDEFEIAYKMASGIFNKYH